MDEQKKVRCWAEIDYQALAQNYQYLRSLAPESAFLGLCKANAYGHGVELIAPALVDFGAEMLAVATAMEGKALRELGIDCPILVLGDTPSLCFPLLADYGLTACLHCYEMAVELSAYGKKRGLRFPCHLKLDSGMGRLGFLPQEKEELQAVLSMEQIMVTGVFTHFASSELGCDFTKEQELCFWDMLSGLKLPEDCLVHLANSGGSLYVPESHRGMIRPGIALYGYEPGGKACQELVPVLSLYARVSRVRAMKKGSAISYGGTAVLQRDSLVAVLPVGYGDGFPRKMSGCSVEILGQACCILGRVCMDMCMVDVTDLEGAVTAGTVAELYGKSGSLLRAAERCDTIPYELLCQVSPRVPRLALGDWGKT